MRFSKKTRFLPFVLSATCVLALASCGKTGVNYLKDVSTGGYEDEANYTYRTYSSLSPSSWNEHNWQTNTDSIIQGYAEMGLYNFMLNPTTHDSWQIQPEMASAEPVAVTLTGDDATAAHTEHGASIETKEGVTSTVAGTVWDIALNKDACWADAGKTAINADTYIYSALQLLDPAMKNYRADTMYSGANGYSIANAEKYFKQGRSDSATLTSIATLLGVKVSDYPAAADAATFFDLSAGTFASASKDGTIGGLKGYCNYYNSFGTGENKVVDTGMTVREFWNDASKGYRVLCSGWADTEQAWDWYLGGEGFGFITWPETKAASLGMVKIDDYKIRLYLTDALTSFYVKYNLSGNWIVYKSLYESGKSTASTGLVTTTYGTSAETYMSYGPYKLTTYEADKQFVLDRNTDWYGYKDSKHTGQYQTDKVVFEIIKENNTALQTFLKGDIDDIGLDSTMMKTYGFSSRLTQAPETYTQKLTFNTSKTALVSRTTKGTNKTIALEKKFRQAFSYAMDRETMCASYTAGFTPSTVLLNQLYYTDFENGRVYRNTDAGKAVEPGIYGTLKNGYDIATAKKLFQDAYTAAVADGNYVSGTPIVLEILLSTTSSTALNARIQFIRDCVDAATKGTDLEGKITLTTKLDEDYYNTSYKGQFDLIFTNWGGQNLDPFGFMDVYCKTGTQCEYGFDPDTEKVEFTVNGAKITKTYADWCKSNKAGGEYAAADLSLRESVLAQLETAVITSYNTVCLAGYASASLNSYKIEYPTTTYVDLVGFGGIADVHYRFNDTEWASAVSTETPNYE